MKAKTRKKFFFFSFVLLAAGFFTTCSNAVTESAALTEGAQIIMNRRSARTQILSRNRTFHGTF